MKPLTSNAWLHRVKVTSIMIVIICLTPIGQPTGLNSVKGQSGFSLTAHRNRLLDTYATRIGAANRCVAWSGMTQSQQGVFLTITDLLGKRSYMQDPMIQYYKNGNDNIDGSCDPPGTDCTAGCYVNEQIQVGGVCVYMYGLECAQKGFCGWEEVPRVDFQTAIEHITQIYAVRPSSFQCGGGEYNRIFFSADDQLITYIRNFYWGLPAWSYSGDPGGPHSPFNNSSETATGTPRGQMHFWRWDYEAQVLSRPGVEGVYDPHIVEIDIDYNWVHDSNPECDYNPYGRTAYQNHWLYWGLGGYAEYEYNPCQ